MTLDGWSQHWTRWSGRDGARFDSRRCGQLVKACSGCRSYFAGKAFPGFSSVFKHPGTSSAIRGCKRKSTWAGRPACLPTHHHTAFAFLLPAFCCLLPVCFSALLWNEHRQTASFTQRAWSAAGVLPVNRMNRSMPTLMLSELAFARRY